MAKSRKLEQEQALLAELRDMPMTPETSEQWCKLLSSRQASIVAQSAKHFGKRGITQFIPELVQAFGRFMDKAGHNDPNCLAKTAIAETLYRLEASTTNLFLQGIRHIQMEPVWGGSTDTAAKLRGNCALGLVRSHHPNVMTELADLLADPEAPARMVAARAIAYSENPQGVPLLRLRARLGDEPQVLAEYLAALLQLAPAQSMTFVSGFLSDPNLQVQELVALALGESKQPEALEPLVSWWKTVRETELRGSGLLAIAMLRTDDAFQFLIDQVAGGPEMVAQAAIQALEIYRQDQDLWQRVGDANDHRRSLNRKENGPRQSRPAKH
ncbi:MAG: HEAT repeat domain-containing protein [Thermosynechococcaceae cyanobacterium]